MAEAVCDSQLLSEQSCPTTSRIEKQTQERAKTAFDHRRVLEADYALAMSFLRELSIIISKAQSSSTSFSKVLAQDEQELAAMLLLKFDRRPSYTSSTNILQLLRAISAKVAPCSHPEQPVTHVTSTPCGQFDF